uniref:Uncharacterized protein n=1 Tax=Rhizophora mucronata TaxID=61149 RepID=A0A2P2QTF8_RHIMU
MDCWRLNVSMLRMMSQGR